MARQPLTLILLHRYRIDRPAVDESEFHWNGFCQNTSFLNDGEKPSSGALVFGAQSVVKVPVGPHWSRLLGVVIDVMVRFDGTFSSRRNIIEADGCFAFYADASGGLHFDVSSKVVGQVVPAWNGVSSVDNSLGAPVTLTPGHWTRLRASFDGITTARLWIDGQRIAERNDFQSALGTPGAAGVSIGNWTLSNVYPLLGALDWVSVWKMNEDAVIKDFVGRGGRDAEIGWGRLMECLRRKLHPETLGSLVQEFYNLLVKVSGILANADAVSRAEFLKNVAVYQQLWSKNQIHDPAYIQAIKNMESILVALGGSSLADGFNRYVSWLQNAVDGSGIDCYRQSYIDKVDPEWTAAFSQFGSKSFSSDSSRS